MTLPDKIYVGIMADGNPAIVNDPEAVEYVRVSKQPSEGVWMPIEEMGEPQLGKRYWLAAYIIPSEEAARNGSKPFWDVQDGLYIGKTWTGILGGKPSHYMDYITPSPPLQGAGQ